MKQPKSVKIHFGRIYYLVAGIVIAWVFLEVRLYQIQLENHEYYTKISINQVEKKINIPASRGIIYDRNNVQLATNLIHYDIGIDKKNLKNPNKLATLFGRIFRNSKTYYKISGQKQSEFK